MERSQSFLVVSTAGFWVTQMAFFYHALIKTEKLTFLEKLITGVIIITDLVAINVS